jgi:hypothetical protein
MKRKGLGKGLGQGYKNIAPMDSHIHSLSAKGVRTVAKPVFRKKNISLNLDMDEIKVASSSILQAREFMKQQELKFPAKDKKKIKEREEYRKEQEDLLNKILDKAEVTYKGKPIPKYKLDAKGWKKIDDDSYQITGKPNFIGDKGEYGYRYDIVEVARTDLTKTNRPTEEGYSIIERRIERGSLPQTGLSIKFFKNKKDAKKYLKEYLESQYTKGESK